MRVLLDIFRFQDPNSGQFKLIRYEGDPLYEAEMNKFHHLQPQQLAPSFESE